MTTYGTIQAPSSPEAPNLEYISRAKDRLASGLGTRRPWKEMFEFHSLGFPPSLNVAIGRVKVNVGYFRMNYVIVMLLILFLSLLWHPISLIVFIVMMAAWLFLYFLRDEPLVILNRVIDDRVVLIVLSVLTIVLLLFTNATANILISVLIGGVLVLVHGALRKTDDLRYDEDSAGTGAPFAAVPSSPSS